MPKAYEYYERTLERIYETALQLPGAREKIGALDPPPINIRQIVRHFDLSTVLQMLPYPLAAPAPGTSRPVFQIATEILADEQQSQCPSSQRLWRAAKKLAEVDAVNHYYPDAEAGAAWMSALGECSAPERMRVLDQIVERWVGRDPQDFGAARLEGLFVNPEYAAIMRHARNHGTTVRGTACRHRRWPFRSPERLRRTRLMAPGS